MTALEFFNSRLLASIHISFGNKSITYWKKIGQNILKISSFVAFSEYLNFMQKNFSLQKLERTNVSKHSLFKITQLFLTPYVVKYVVCNAVVRQMETIPRTLQHRHHTFVKFLLHSDRRKMDLLYSSLLSHIV